MSSFITVRGHAISLESQSENLLTKYSSFAQTTSSEPDSQEKSLESRLENLLSERQGVIDSLQKICDESSNTSSSKLLQLQRHREILRDHWQTFRGIRSSIHQERNRLNLLFSVKKDLAQNSTHEDDTYIQEESRRVEKSHNVVDRLISRAFETKDQFTSQRIALQSNNDKLIQTLQRIPGINSIITKINTRRKKNSLILASLITMCALILFFTW